MCVSRYTEWVTVGVEHPDDVMMIGRVERRLRMSSEWMHSLNILRPLWQRCWVKHKQTWWCRWIERCSQRATAFLSLSDHVSFTGSAGMCLNGSLHLHCSLYPYSTLITGTVPLESHEVKCLAQGHNSDGSSVLHNSGIILWNTVLHICY